MKSAAPGQERRYAEIVEILRNAPNVSCGGQGTKGFGSSALKVHGKIFAMVSSAGEFVVKLPSQRVGALEAAHVGRRFEAGKGRPMREWLALDPGAAEEWLPLAIEALHFVGGGSWCPPS